MYSYDFRDRVSSDAPAKDLARLQKVKKELDDISDRLRELADEVDLSPETIKLLPKASQAKAGWLDYPKTASILESAATKVGSASTALKMGISLAEAAGLK